VSLRKSLSETFPPQGKSEWQAIAGEPRVRRTEEAFDLEPVYFTSMRSAALAGHAKWTPLVLLSSTDAQLTQHLKDAAEDGCEVRIDPSEGPFAATIQDGTAPAFDGESVLDDLWSERGANLSDAMALQLAQGVAALRAAEGADFDARANALRLVLRADSRFFHSIAALRALRELWDGIRAACGLTGSGTIELHPNRSSLTRLDPWVNMLRATAMGFAGAVGGADFVAVPTYDQAMGASSDRGQRTARNLHHLLAEEAHLDHVRDPAAGSWFLETLTAELKAKTWAYFQDIEAEGGLFAALDSGSVRIRLDRTAASRASRIAKRKRAITGVSTFPLASETVDPATAPDMPWPAVRWAEPFEAFRSRPNPPTVTIATLGPLAEHNARVGFTQNLLATGGIASDVVPLADAKGTAVVIAGSDKRYAQEAAAAAKDLKARGVRFVALAGRGAEIKQALEQAGVDHFLYAGGDVLASVEAFWRHGGDQ